MRRNQAMSLVELLIAIAATAVLLSALAFSYSSALRWQTASAGYAAQLEQGAPYEDGLRKLLSSAYLTSDAGDPTSYFIATNSQGAGEASDTLQFTRIADPPSARALEDVDEFETRNERHGVLGGLEEAALSPVPVGGEAEGEGLFLRRQRPSDGEPTQGGRESLYASNLTEIQFEFYDGLDWQTEWDTNGLSPRRLPSAVRVTYRLVGEDEARVMVVPLKHSDATPEDPAILEAEDGA